MPLKRRPVDSAGNRIGHLSTVITVLGVDSGPNVFVDCVVTLNNGSKLAFSGPGELPTCRAGASISSSPEAPAGTPASAAR